MPKPKVFLSYAHESDAHRAAVYELADGLTDAGAEVVCDRPYRDRPPAAGWISWMLGSIEQADVVLIVCSPKLKERFENINTGRGEGRGAIHEGAIVTQKIYDAYGQNDKFYPVLPDGGRYEDLPLILRDWTAGHRFPSGADRIWRLVTLVAAGTPAVDAQSGVDDNRPSPVMSWGRGDQEALVHERLGVPAAAPFRDGLLAKVRGLSTSSARPETTDDLIERVVDLANTRHAEELFVEVFYLLKSIPTHDRRVRQAAEEAATAIYVLIAIRALTLATPEAFVVDAGRHVIRVPTVDELFTGLLAAAIFGGQVELTSVPPVDGRAGPIRKRLPHCVFRVGDTPGGDQPWVNLERAIYTSVFANEKAALDAHVAAGELSRDERSKLAVRIRLLRHGSAPAFLLEGVRLDVEVDVKSLAMVAERVGAPIAVEDERLLDDGVLTEALGLAPLDIVNYFGELWAIMMSDFTRPPADDTGQTPFPNHGHAGPVTVHVTGDQTAVSVSTAGSATAQASGGRTLAGRGKSPAAFDRRGARLPALLLGHILPGILPRRALPGTRLVGLGATRDFHHGLLGTEGERSTELLAVLLSMQDEIAELPSARARDTLTTELDSAVKEVRQGPGGDRGLVKRVLDSVAQATKVVDGAEKLAASCARALEMLGQWIT